MVSATTGNDFNYPSEHSPSCRHSTVTQQTHLNSIVNKETSSMDAQHVLGAIDQLLSLNGWVAAHCPTLIRPFGQNKRDNAYDDLIREDHLYYVAIIIHSADHFLVDQLAVIVQMAKRLGTNNLFVSMLDYDSTDSTETLTDLCEAVLTLLGVPFRIRRVSGMTEDPGAAYYPLEEAHMRNLALEPLHELQSLRSIKFSRVIWLKGFTCPNDLLETIKISFANEASMVCGMDWAEHNGFFIFSDRSAIYLLLFIFQAHSHTGGEHAISRVTNSDNPNLPQNPTPSLLATVKAPCATPNISRFKSSAVNPARTSSIPRSRTTEALCIAPGQISRI